jgi:predicted ATPase
MSKNTQYIHHNNAYIITGTMGTGKSTLLHELKKLDLKTVSEPARAILSEERLIQSEALPEQDANLFTRLLLSRSIHFFNTCTKDKKPVFFDRGLPDLVAYAKLFMLDPQLYLTAAKKMRYNKTVFFLPIWEEIYGQDDERKMTFHEAKTFNDALFEIYQQLEYTLITLPLASVSERADFILNKIKPHRAQTP